MMHRIEQDWYSLAAQIMRGEGDVHAARNELREALFTAGFTPWMDVESLPGGEAWRRAIELEISQADFILTAISQK